MNEETRIRVKQVATYGGHSLSSNGSVNLTLKASYSELPKSIELMQMLNNDVLIRTRVPGEKVKRLGEFRIKAVNINGDGESILKFNGLNDFVEMNNLNNLPLSSDSIKEFVVMYQAYIEHEDDVQGGDGTIPGLDNLPF